MIQMDDSGEDIVLYGKSGHSYQGRIYSDKNSTTTITTSAITCLSNSRYTDCKWEHQIKDVYNAADSRDALKHFREREDRTHLILIPGEANDSSNVDKVADLIQNYIHK